MFSVRPLICGSDKVPVQSERKHIPSSFSYTPFLLRKPALCQRNFMLSVSTAAFPCQFVWIMERKTFIVQYLKTKIDAPCYKFGQLSVVCVLIWQKRDWSFDHKHINSLTLFSCCFTFSVIISWLSPYTPGVNCEVEIDECESGPCRNRATCHDLIGMYACECLPGFDGIDCEVDVDECVSEPCQNGAVCHDMVNR